MNKINIKPLSVNQAWMGRKFKTKFYKDYEIELALKLPKLKINKENKLELNLIVGYSNRSSDIDNFLKPFIDVLQKKYLFNDRNIYKLNIVKEIVKKGSEFIQFEINEIE